LPNTKASLKPIAVSLLQKSSAFLRNWINWPPKMRGNVPCRTCQNDSPSNTSKGCLKIRKYNYVLPELQFTGFLTKTWIFDHNFDFFQKHRFLPKNPFLANISTFNKTCIFDHNFIFFTKNIDFCQRFWQKHDHNFDVLPKMTISDQFFHDQNFDY